MNSSKIFQFALTVILLVAVFLFATHRAKREPVTVIETQVDTLYIHDTTIVETPKIVQRTVVDTLMYEVRDTLRIEDTLYVYLPKERVVYEDSLYRAVVSGYRPSLDSLILYTTERYVTIVEKEKAGRWGVGLSVGYGASVNGLSPYVGVGVTYNLIDFSSLRTRR